MKNKEPLQNQVDRLAQFIIDECEGWPKDGGAIDTAIQIIKNQQADYDKAVKEIGRLQEKLAKF